MMPSDPKHTLEPIKTKKCKKKKGEKKPYQSDRVFETSRAKHISSLFKRMFESVGKKIGSSIWVHKSQENVLPRSELEKAKEKLNGFSYTVIRYDKETGNFSFIKSSDFDSNSEPTVEDSLLVKKDGSATHTKRSEDPFIYHKKELMVGEDYKGFDIQKAKDRTSKIEAMNLNKSLIGRKSYWEKNVLPKLKGK